MLLGCFSCGTGNYVKIKYVQIQGTPDTDCYLKNQHSYSDSDGFERFGASSDVANTCKEWYTLVGSTDSDGYGILKLSTQEYKRSKKQVIAVKSGYVPSEFKLKKRFNTSVLFNLLLPVTFFFDHATTLSTKAVNRFKMSEESTQTCWDYLDMAENSFKQEDKINYLKKAIGQDYRNENGVKIAAMNMLGNIYGAMGDTHLAYLILNQAYQEDQCLEIEESKERLKENINLQNWMAAQKREKRKRTFNTISMISNSLSSVGNALAVSSGTVGTVSSANGISTEVVTNSTKANGSSNTSTFGSAKETIFKNRDSNTYSDYETQLIKMHANSESYNDSQRRHIQQQMKMIRERWQKRGYKMSQSEWETWGGS